MANLRSTLDTAASTTAGAPTAASATTADQGSSADQAAGGAEAVAAGSDDAEPGPPSSAAGDNEGVDAVLIWSTNDRLLCPRLGPQNFFESPMSPDCHICCHPTGSSNQASLATPAQPIRRHSSLAAAVGGLSVSTLRTISSSNPQLAQPPPQWMLFNDFVIRETLPAEVQATYAGQKTPCMLYYTRVRRCLVAAAQRHQPHFTAAALSTNMAPQDPKEARAAAVSEPEVGSTCRCRWRPRRQQQLGRWRRRPQY